MTEPIKEFDRDRYVGQVHVWVTDNGQTLNGKPLVSAYICRRYTNEEHNDDDQWGIWLHITGTDYADVALKMLHFCDACRYEVTSDERPCESDTIEYRRISQKIYATYKDEADAAKDALADIGSNASDEIRSLFAGFVAAQQLGVGPQ